jgi:hypothetical protein
MKAYAFQMPLLQYILPNYDFGVPDDVTRDGVSFVRDHVTFRCAEREWRLRRMYVVEEQSVSAPQGYRLRASNSLSVLADSAHALLETEGNVGLRHEIDGWATDLCWILQMGRGSQLRWTEVRIDDGTNYRSLEARSGSRLPPWDGGSPIKNQADHALRRLVENAWPVFQRHRDWWRVTADWFAWAHSVSTNEVSGLICSMLLERTTEFVLSEMIVGNQIDPALEQTLDVGGEQRDALAREMTALWRRYSPLWPEEQTQSLLNTVQQWNRSPSYRNQIRLAFERYHLEVPPARLLENRHSLAHGGTLSSRTSNPGNYLSEIIGTVVRLLLRMLNYSGSYFVLSQGVATLPPLPESCPSGSVLS